MKSIFPPHTPWISLESVMIMMRCSKGEECNPFSLNNSKSKETDQNFAWLPLIPYPEILGKLIKIEAAFLIPPPSPPPCALILQGMRPKGRQRLAKRPRTTQLCSFWGKKGVSPLTSKGQDCLFAQQNVSEKIKSGCSCPPGAIPYSISSQLNAKERKGGKRERECAFRKCSFKPWKQES